MRLTCPNCDAQYEVEDRTIPEGGRDVQCSGCGHAWFQLPPEVEDRLRDEAIACDDEPAPALTVAATEPEPVAPVEPVQAPAPKPEDPPGQEDQPRSDTGFEADTAREAKSAPEADSAPEVKTAPEATEDAPQPKRRALDENLRDLLREEAARESQARRAEGASLETQGDLGLDEHSAGRVAGDAARQRIGRLRGDEALGDETANDGAPVPRGAARRDLLPDIEEINSSLRASSERRRTEPGAEVETPQQRRRGFRMGFGLVLLLAAFLVAAYADEQRIVASVPASAGVMQRYIATVDRGRIWLSHLMTTATQKMRGNDGASGGAPDGGNS